LTAAALHGQAGRRRRLEFPLLAQMYRRYVHDALRAFHPARAAGRQRNELKAPELVQHPELLLAPLWLAMMNNTVIHPEVPMNAGTLFRLQVALLFKMQRVLARRISMKSGPIAYWQSDGSYQKQSRSLSDCGTFFGAVPPSTRLCGLFPTQCLPQGHAVELLRQAQAYQGLLRGIEAALRIQHRQIVVHAGLEASIRQIKGFLRVGHHAGLGGQPLIPLGAVGQHIRHLA
jgi:hypothetical protein